MKSQHKIAVLLLGFVFGGRASALDAFECVRDLMEITGPASFQIHRTGVEKPFMATPKYMAFPEIKAGRVSGFYVYTVGQAWYYDTLSTGDAGGRPMRLSELDPKADPVLYQLVVQPLGLETVTLFYMPGFGVQETTGQAPTALGSTVLPVVGGFMARSGEPLASVYQNPTESSDADMQTWLSKKHGRSPASGGETQYARRMAKLSTQQTKAGSDLWKPLRTELKDRRNWLQNHNLTSENFKRLSQFMQTTCRE